ncbi:MAG: DUF4388 domain-containing protein [Gemmatimonas sp.]
MSLEGNLRDLALAEVCQLLVHTRKSGQLRLSAPLTGLEASISFVDGAIVGAEIDGLGMLPMSDFGAIVNDAAQAVETTTLELLCWQDGTFRFVPRAAGEPHFATGVRLNTELVLMEGTRRSEQWARLADRIPGARSVPTFVDVEPRQLPLLNLQPQQWEVLTGVDGRRDLPMLAHSIGRDLLEVAEIVHGLIGSGLLTLAESPRTPRTQATPPSNDVLSPVANADVWVPFERNGRDALEEDLNDEIFDPIRVGVVTPEGLPRYRTPSDNMRVADATRPATFDDTEPQSSHRALGDAAARRGDLDSAIRHWSRVVQSAASGASIDGRFNAVGDLEHAQEAMALAQRLLQLLHRHQPVS